MTYFLGRDVDVFVTLEATTASTAVGLEADVQGTTIPVCALVTSGATGPDTNIFANTMQSDATVLASRVHDLTGVDLSISTSDEEVGPFMGQVSTQSVELRKDMTVTLTHKKSDELWDAIYNGPSNGLEFEGRETDATGDTNSNTTLDGLTSTAGYRVGMFIVGAGIPKGTIIAAIVDANTVTMSASATATANVPVSFLDLPAYLHQGARFGVMYTGSTPLISMGRTNPKSAVSGATYALHPSNPVNYGYRVHVRMKDTAEVYTVRNAAITGHTVTLNADGVTEETLELKSSVLPTLYTGATNTFDTTMTTVGEM
jgi:hypothetical protein|tara:strand:+ start:4518 stop:5462 length:945 start_codon:yes stop_codon:yes gene_type:complete